MPGQRRPEDTVCYPATRRAISLIGIELAAGHQ
jgi:hypothetical protein